MSGMRRLWWTLRTAKRNLGNGRASATVAAGSIALTLVLTTASLLLGTQAERLQDHWAGRADVTVYLCARSSISPQCRGITTAEQVQTQEALLAAHPSVKRYWFEDRDDAWAAFTKRFAGSSILENLDANSLPESYRIKINDGVDRKTFVGEITQALEVIGGFDAVQDQRETLSGFFSVTEKVRIGALVLAAFQASISIALMAHLLRSSVTKRRKDIRVMGLVGTSHQQIRAPFVLEALTVYTAGVLAAATVVVAGLGLTRQLLERVGGSEALIVGTASAARSMLTVYFVGLLVSWITVRLALRARLHETN